MCIQQLTLFNCRSTKETPRYYISKYRVKSITKGLISQDNLIRYNIQGNVPALVTSREILLIRLPKLDTKE